MFLVLKPPFILILFGEKVESKSPTYGRILSILNSILLALVYIAIRKVKNKANALTFNLYLSVCGMLIPPLAM